MTVLAFLDELGLAFADVMLSVNTPGNHILLPTAGHTSNIKATMNLSPSRLVRKFFRLKGTQPGMFLVAGTVSHLDRLIDNLGALRAGQLSLNTDLARTYNSKSVESLINTACTYTELQGYDEFELLGIVGDQLYARIYNAHKVAPLPYFGSIFIAGSGGLDLYRWLQERAVFYAEGALASDALIARTQRAMNSIPMMLLEEDTLSRAKTLTNGVGGYYETYWLEGGNLHALDDVLTVSARIEESGSLPKLSIERMYYHRYASDWLFVISLFNTPVLLSPTGHIDIPISQFELFPIPPVFDCEPQPNWSSIKLLQAATTAETFRLTLRRDTHQSPIHKRFSEGARPGRRLLELTLVGQRLRLSINVEGLRYYVERFRPGQPNEPVLQLTV